MFIYKYNAKKDAFAKKLTGWIKNEYLREIFRCLLNFKFCFLEELIQNYLIEFKNLEAENLTVVVIPEKNAMSGAIYSFFRLAYYTKKHFKDDAEVLVMTRTYPTRETYAKQVHFNTDEIVFRFEQINKFKKVKNLTIHIPEYATKDFYKLINNKTKKYLSQIDNIHINILNQNINLMPEKEDFADLYKITSNITQSVSHLSYCTQEIADKYGLKTIYFNIPHEKLVYPFRTFSEKKDIIIYSPDNHHKKDSILKKIKRELPEFELLEIKHIKFEKFIKLTSEVKFSITFGEGYDGYFLSPVVEGGVGLAVYNEEFFPADEYKEHINVFLSYEDMEENIVNVIKKLNSDEELYQKTQQIEYDNYIKYTPSRVNFEEYLKRFINGDFDFDPKTNEAIV